MDGQIGEARDRVVKYVEKIKRRAIEIRIAELADLCFDAELELQLGNPE